MSESKSKLSRRNFLLAIGAGGAAGAAAVAAVAAKAVPKTQPVADVAGKRSTKSYQASAHVRNYYRTTKV
jgi:shikimate 5-dehydrogenase